MPSVVGLSFETARSGSRMPAFRYPNSRLPVNSTASEGSVVGTSPTGQVLPSSIITINTSTGIAPPPPPEYRPPRADPGDTNVNAAPPPPEVPPIEGGPPPGVNVIEIPGLPPITVPVMPPAPPPPPAPEPLPPPAPLPPPPAPEPLPPGDIPPA